MDHPKSAWLVSFRSLVMALSARSSKANSEGEKSTDIEAEGLYYLALTYGF